MGIIISRHPLSGLTEAVAEFISEETCLQILLPSSVPLRSASSPTALATSYLYPTSRGPLTHGSCYRGPLNQEQQSHGFSTQTPNIICRYCKKPGHMVSICNI